MVAPGNPDVIGQYPLQQHREFEAATYCHRHSQPVSQFDQNTASRSCAVRRTNNDSLLASCAHRSFLLAANTGQHDGRRALPIENIAAIRRAVTFDIASAVFHTKWRAYKARGCHPASQTKTRLLAVASGF